MHNGICHRCGAATVRAAANSLSSQSTHTTMWPPHQPGVRGIFKANLGQVWQYVCTTCGVMEWRIHDPATIAWINANWVAVPVQQDQPPG
ncbi:hypothetical protein F0U44_03625 [Nocardioides humilatus]|uniref:Uncharacterized protein n=1 Tax=Nocardioides humilatus TaxID=2607660 RepID=A0A5B1LNP3_9ACTN|nr:hypothetical protein [Nocardioides humilatus]KAA1421400.1 hypothetical protein F0U44_03625 [Nocardioides humilatus]